MSTYRPKGLPIEKRHTATEMIPVPFYSIDQDGRILAATMERLVSTGDLSVQFAPPSSVPTLSAYGRQMVENGRKK